MEVKRADMMSQLMSISQKYDFCHTYMTYLSEKSFKTIIFTVQISMTFLLFYCIILRFLRSNISIFWRLHICTFLLFDTFSSKIL